ncbi:hypothetical protein B296_00041974 [Ensete ventricosum]|uniref:Uncharacterized protein n=1 Tax=Ensete ventricosum TaxID=4639 RepID=A0A426XAE4_ENSVE|nr:hypothetical protein B296_00041974 [Ensete ventricosum]
MGGMYQSDRILVYGPPTTGWYRRIRSLLAQKRGDASSPRTGQGNAWSPRAKRGDAGSQGDASSPRAGRGDASFLAVTGLADFA